MLLCPCHYLRGNSLPTINSGISIVEHYQRLDMNNWQSLSFSVSTISRTSSKINIVFYPHDFQEGSWFLFLRGTLPRILQRLIRDFPCKLLEDIVNNLTGFALVWASQWGLQLSTLFLWILENIVNPVRVTSLSFIIGALKRFVGASINFFVFGCARANQRRY